MTLCFTTLSCVTALAHIRIFFSMECSEQFGINQIDSRFDGDRTFWAGMFRTRMF